MKISLASDLHLEFPRADRTRALKFPEQTDLIILAGDIGSGMGTPAEALDLAEEYPLAHVIWVAGNHEFYQRNLCEQLDMYRRSCEGNERVHFLENDFVDIGKIRFIGCTLWTDFAILGDAEQGMYVARRGITDFSLIKTGEGQLFTPQDAADRFKQSSEYLQKTLSESEPQRTVVVTHFPPGMDTRNQNFGIDAITAYFQANVDHIIDEFQPALWIYGHNHYSNDLYRGKTRLVSSQLGYPSEAGRIPDYDPTKIVEMNSD